MQVLNRQKLKFSLKLIHEKICELLTAHKIHEEAARITAEVLIEGSVRGYKNHGIDRILQILEGLENDTIKPQVSPSIIKKSSATAVIDGNYGLGYPLGKQAMDMAILKAKQLGVGIVGVINASHIGVLSYYSEIASRNECIGIVMSTSSPAVVLKGGKIKTFGTNPISYSIPFYQHPITADCATSKVSRGLIYEHLALGKPIPPGWAVDRNGTATSDPAKALEGGLQTFDGDIKGSIFSMLISILAGNLIGGVMNPKVCGTRNMSEKPNKGDLFIALHIESFTEPASFLDGIEELVNFIKNQKSDFRIPGENAYKRKHLHKKEILLSEEVETLFGL